jgi:hypothetical protein
LKEEEVDVERLFEEPAATGKELKATGLGAGAAPLTPAFAATGKELKELAGRLERAGDRYPAATGKELKETWGFILQLSPPARITASLQLGKN